MIYVRRLSRKYLLLNIITVEDIILFISKLMVSHYVDPLVKYDFTLLQATDLHD